MECWAVLALSGADAWRAMICCRVSKPTIANAAPPASSATTIARFFRVVTVMTILQTPMPVRRTCYLKTPWNLEGLLQSLQIGVSNGGPGLLHAQWMEYG